MNVVEILGQTPTMPCDKEAKKGSGPHNRQGTPRPTPHTEPHTEPEATSPVHTFSKVYTGEVEQPLHKSKHKSARPGPGGRFSGNPSNEGVKTYLPAPGGRFSGNLKTYLPAPGGRFSGNPPSSDDASVGHFGLIAASHGGQGPELAGASPGRTSGANCRLSWPSRALDRLGSQVREVITAAKITRRIPIALMKTALMKTIPDD